MPILWREDDPDGNPWDLSFMAMIHMANDSGSFRTAEQLTADGWTLDGNAFVRDEERMLPLYEAKMVYQYDHRLGTYEGQTEAQSNVGTLPRFDDFMHDDPACVPLPRYFIDSRTVDSRLGDRWHKLWLFGWRNITNGGNERTLVSSLMPRTAVAHAVLLAFTDSNWQAGLVANLSAYAVDYVVRQKFSGTNLVYMYVRQLPVLPPVRYDDLIRWDPTSKGIGRWISDRVLELIYTAYDMEPYARDFGDGGPPFRWEPKRREMMRAELDAAYFHLYAIERDDVDYIMDTFNVVRDKDQAKHGEYRTKRLILERYDAMATALRTGVPYQTLLDPPPGSGPRHPAAHGPDGLGEAS